MKEGSTEKLLPMQGIGVSIFNAEHWVGIALDLAFDVREATTRLLPYATKRECNQHKSKLFVFGLLVGYIFSATGVDSTGCTSCVHTEQELTGSLCV